MNKIQVIAKRTYGTQRFYPVDQTAKLFAEIAAKPTLTPGNLKAIRTLGFEIEIIAEPIHLEGAGDPKFTLPKPDGEPEDPTSNAV